MDEVQRGGDDLVRAVKLAVDADPSPGAFLLTGSAGFLTVPVLSESLAGRAVFLDLAPFSDVEIEGGAGGLLPRLLRIIAARTAGGFVLQDIHRDLGMGSAATTADYVSYLEMTYLVAGLGTWATSAATRAKRHPKVYLTDTGLAAALLSVTAESLLDPAEPTRGPMYETFAVNELRR